MGKIFYVEFQRVLLKFHTKYLTHTPKETIFTQDWNFRISQIYELINVFEMLYFNSIQIWLKCVPKGSVNSMLALVQMMFFVEGRAMEMSAAMWRPYFFVLFMPMHRNTSDLFLSNCRNSSAMIKHDIKQIKNTETHWRSLNSLRPSDAYMRK